MPYYPTKNILFIHIPKTGGTIVEDKLKEKLKQTLYSGYTNVLLPYPFCNLSLQHQFYTTLYHYRDICKINFKGIKIFTIVRNPYDRLISDLFWYKLIDYNTTPDDVYKIILNNFIFREDLDNHNLPQYRFITNENGKLIPNIKIFKTEDLNNHNLILNKYLGVNIDIKKNNINKDYSRFLNKETINLINTFYYKDFILFNYNMK